MTMNTARQIAMNAFPGRILNVHYNAWFFPESSGCDASYLVPWSLSVWNNNEIEQVDGKTFDQCMSKMRAIIYPNNGGDLVDGDVGVDDDSIEQERDACERMLK